MCHPFNVFNYPSTAQEIEVDSSFITHNQMGIDTIELIAKYETFINMIKKNNLTVTMLDESHNSYKRVLEGRTTDDKIRLKEEDFKPIVERIELPKVNPKDKGFYITIIRNIPLLFDIATHRKKAKDSYCLIIFAGLHQPTKRISSESVKIISKILKRKAFRLHKLDIAIDTEDKEPINYERKEPFRGALEPYSTHGVTIPSYNATSLYINKVEHSSINRILYYDKYQKQKKDQKEIIKDNLKEWKRFEVTLSFDVTKSHNRGFRYYIDSSKFIDDLFEIDEIANKTGIEEYEKDYLTYQLNSLIDNRVMNNKESKKQFNSFGALERFKASKFKRFDVGLLDSY